jgi:hypothetical protein
MKPDRRPLRVRDARPRIGNEKNITFWVGNCAVRYTKRTARMSALGQKQTSAHVGGMSALLPKADID